MARRSLIAVLWFVVCARALPAVAQYRVESFTTSNGLPQNTVSAIVQTRDGFVWAATYDGLVRYDGLRFTTFDRGNTPAIRSTQFLSLYEDVAGSLWAGTGDGGLLRYRDGAFTTYTTANGLPMNYVGRIQPADGGLLLYLSDLVPSALFTFDGKITAGQQAETHYTGPSGTRWTYERTRIVARKDGRTIAYPIALTATEFGRFRFEDRDGGLWIGTFRDGAYYAARGAVRHFADVDGVPTADVVRIAGQDRLGRVWFYGPDAVFYFDGTLHRLALPDVRPVRSVLCDREGTVWVGTNEHGLLHLVPEALHTYSTGEGLPHPIVYPLVEDKDGSILAGSGAAVARLANGRFTSTRVPGPVSALWLDPDETLWISAMSTLWTLKDGVLRDRSDLAGGASINVMLRDRAGVLWAGAGARSRLLRIEDSERNPGGVVQGFPGGVVMAMLEDHAGRLWIGTNRGLVRRDGDRFTLFTAADGLAGDRVRSLHEDRDGALWIGTADSGLGRLKDGRFTTYTTRNGLLSNGVFAILEDAAGWFWMSSNRGIFRVARAELDAIARGEASVVHAVGYGVADGMRSVECNGGRQPAGIRGRDGTLWFPTQDGIVHVDPAHAVPDVPASPVTLESIVVDGTARPAADRIEIAPGQQDLEIEYTAPAFVKPEYVHYRYALGRPGDAWVDAGTRRSIHLSHLAPGNYTFTVAAQSIAGRWTDRPATIAVIVQPFFYQTAWFRGLVLLAIVGGIAGVAAARVRTLQRAERILTARVAQATAELAAANRRLERLATIDALTEVANRRRFEEFFEQEWHRAIRSEEPIALLIVDVDHFKAFNDTRGHQAGDECLRQVGAVLRGAVHRTSDLAARYGGEEFVVVLGATDERGAERVAEGIRHDVEALQVPHGASSAAPWVTVSIGVAVTRPVVGDPRETLFAVADAALYRAKASGRNRAMSNSTVASAE